MMSRKWFSTPMSASYAGPSRSGGVYTVMISVTFLYLLVEPGGTHEVLLDDTDHDGVDVELWVRLLVP
jgi:hypothetical protein